MRRMHGFSLMVLAAGGVGLYPQPPSKKSPEQIQGIVCRSSRGFRLPVGRLGVRNRLDAAWEGKGILECWELVGMDGGGGLQDFGTADRSMDGGKTWIKEDP